MAQERVGSTLTRPSAPARSPKRGGQAETRPEPARIRPSQPRVGLVVVVIASAVAFVLGAKFAGSPELSPAKVASAYASLLPTAPDPPHAISRGAQRLEWAPVAGADGYEVAIYRGGQRVYFAHTAVPRLDLSSSVRRGLPSGTLAWYVWPTRKGVPDTSPIVHSLLSSSVLGVGR